MPIVRVPGGARPVLPTGAVVLDIQDGGSVDITKDGPRTTRIAQVGGLGGQTAARLWFAINATGLPRYGDVHPAIPGLPVSNLHAEFEKGSTELARITIEYSFATGGPQNFLNVPGDTLETLPQLAILSSMQPATTQFELLEDDSKKQIVVTYTVEDEETQISTEVTQGGSVEFLVPTETVRYTRREPQDPQAKGRIYKGRINSVGVFGDGPLMWLCTRLDGVSDDGGASFNVTYEFQRNIDSWNPTVVPTDPETGTPVVLSQADIDGGLAVRTVRIYPRADFFGLNLVLPG